MSIVRRADLTSGGFGTHFPEDYVILGEQPSPAVVKAETNSETSSSLSASESKPDWTSFSVPILVLPPSGVRSVRIDTVVRGADSGKPRRLKVSFRNDINDPVPATGNMVLDPVYGSILEVKGGGEFEREISLNLEIPPGGAAALLECVDAEPGFEFDKSRTDLTFVATLDFAIEQVANHAQHGLVLIDSLFGEIGGSQELLRHRLIASSLVDEGFGVVYCHNSETDVEVLGNGFAQLSRRHLSTAITALETYENSQLIYWIGGVPTVRSMMVANQLRLSDWQVVYESLDMYDLLARRNGLKWFRSAIERNLAKMSDAVVVPNDQLLTYYSGYLSGHKKLIVLPDPIPTAFSDAAGQTEAITRRKRRKIGIIQVGPHVESTKKFVTQTARSMPDVEFEVLTRGNPGVKAPDNVSYLEQDASGWGSFVDLVSQWALAVAPISPGALTYSEGNSYQMLLDRLSVPTVYIPKYSDTPTANGKSVSNISEVHDEIRKAYYGLGSNQRTPSQQLGPTEPISSVFETETKAGEVR